MNPRTAESWFFQILGIYYDLSIASKRDRRGDQFSVRLTTRPHVPFRLTLTGFPRMDRNLRAPLQEPGHQENL